MSKYDPESVLPTVEEQTVTPENEEEVVRSMRREEVAAQLRDEREAKLATMSEYDRRRANCTHDYDCCPCFPEDPEEY